MSAVKITTNAPSKDRELTVAYDFGDNLKEAVRLFGEDIVFQHFFDNARIALQGFIRSRLVRDDKDFMTDAAIKAAVRANFKLGGRTVDPKKRVERVAKDLAKLDDKTRARLFRQWQTEQERKLVKTAKPTPASPVMPESIVEEQPEQTEPKTV